MEREVFENRILASRQGDGLPRAGNGASPSVDENVVDFDIRLRLTGRAANQGAEARKKFGKVERLDEVIVGAGVESAHAVFGCITRSEQEDGSLFLFAEASQNFPAVETREHEVENDSIVVIGFGFEEAGIAGFGGIDGVAFFAQGFGQIAEQARFVFDNKNSHFGD